jgi:hypothetical protein
MAIEKKSTAPAGDRENHTGVAVQYLQIVLHIFICFLLDQKATKNQGFAKILTNLRSFR